MAIAQMQDRAKSKVEYYYEYILQISGTIYSIRQQKNFGTVMATRKERGFTLFELLVSTGLFALLAGVAASNLKSLDDPLQNGASILVSFLKQVRSKSISSTSAYRVSADSTNQIITKSATSCSDASPVIDPQLYLDLPTGVSVTDISWDFCFTSRGLADSNVEIELVDHEGITKTVEVLLGGAARIK